MGTVTFALAIWGGISLLLNLLLGWRNYALSRQKDRREIPFLLPADLRDGVKPVLGGPNAEIWEIKSFRIARPRRARFYVWDEASGRLTSRVVGRSIEGSKPTLLVASAIWPVRLSCKIALKSDPRSTRSLDALLSK